jgi:ATP-dependent Lon protease
MIHTNHIPKKATLPAGHRANRCKAQELNEAYRLHHMFEARVNLAREASKPQSHPGQRQLFDPAELKAKKAWLGEMVGDNQKAMLKILQKMGADGPYRNVAKAPEPAVLDGLLEDFPNFDAVTRAIQKHLLLCRRGPEKLLKIPAILLNGPPGLGKTAYCAKLATLLGIRFEQVDLASGGANFTLTGLDSGYGSGHPGRIFESLQHGSMSVLWQLDEVDKCQTTGSHSGSQHLLGLLEPATAACFIDNAALLPLNAAWIFYVATSNDKTNIDAPLRSRFEVFDIQKPDGRQLLAIVKSIHRGILETEPWAKTFEANLDDALIEALSNYSPREIRRQLIDAFASAASQGRNQLLATDVASKSKHPEENERRIGFV